MKLFVLLWILWTSVSSQTPEFTQHPVSMNYNKGEEFLFTCSATNVDALIFFANGTQPSADQEFIQTPSIIPDGLSTSNLTGMALIQHNNTNISCFGAVVGGDDVISDIAVLLVQGPLSSVGGLSYSFINSSTVDITWSPPFTLPGTNIIGYNISVATNTSTVEAFTPNNYIEITVSTCIETIITVTGYNGLDGESSTILIDVNVSSISVTVNTLMEINEMVIFDLNFNISDQCPQHIPTLVNITIQYSNGTTVDNYNNIPLEQLSTDNILTTAENITLVADQYYNATIVYSNTEGIINTTTNIDYNTFSIQFVTLTDTIGPVIVVVCTFRPNAAAVGCLIQLLTDNTVQYNSTSTRTDDQAIVILSGVTTGSYQLRVFEVESDQSLVPVSHLEEELTIIESATITTLIMSSTTTIGLGIINSFTASSVNETDMVTPTVTTKTKGNADNNLSIIGAVVGAILLLVAVVIILLVFGVLVWYNRNRSNNKNNNNNVHAVNYSNGGSEQVIVDNEKKNVDQDDQTPEDHEESPTRITDDRVDGYSMNTTNTDDDDNDAYNDNDDTTANDDSNTATVTANNEDVTTTDTSTAGATAPNNNTYEDVIQFKLEHKLDSYCMPKQQISDSELKKILSKKPADIVYAELGDAPRRCRPRIEVGTSFVYADIKPKLPPKKKKITETAHDNNEDSALQ